MGIPPRQIGWSNESNLLWQLSKQMDKLTGVTSANLSAIIADLATKVTNQLGTPSFRSDTLANLPTAGQTGRMFIATDTFAFYRDNGVGWDLIGGPGVGTVTGSGTATQVAFWNGSSVLSGSSNLFWDSANNRLGVGTTSPAVRLDVNGDVNLATGYTLSWGGAYGANIPSIAGVSGVGSNIRFYPSGSTTGETMRITSNGNVLVGTTTDAGYRLDVSGNIRSNNGLWVTNTLNPAVGVMTWGAFGGTNIQIGSWSLNTPVYFVLGSSPRMRLGGIAAGDVGQLTVGNVSSSDAAWVSTSYLLALGVSASLENNNEGSTFYSYNAYRSAGGLRYIASNPALSFGLDFNKFVWRSAASGTSGNLITFTESMTLDINGRLGIGTTSPNASALLDVSSTTRGFLPPRQTQAQRTAIGSPATGLVVYQTDGVEDIYYNTSAGWQSITSNILTKFRIYNTFRL